MKVLFLLRKEKACVIREGYATTIMLLLLVHTALLSRNSLR